MGAGKSTIGRLLADTLNLSFHDLDLMITEHTGLAVPEIIRRDGEDAFRNMEREVLRNVAGLRACVVACGGGTPCHADNLGTMKAAGTVVYLRLTPHHLAARLRKDRSERPMLDGIGSEGLESFIVRHLANRESFYLQADIVWDADSMDVADLAERLVTFRKDVNHSK